MELEEYLKINRWTVSEVARVLDYSRCHIDAIVYKRFFPSKKLARKIEEFTNGEVKAQDLLRKKEVKNEPEA